MDIALIWAMSENRVIGRDNGLPWRLPNEMRHFMNTTMGKPVIMGRKTFESMKSALPGRTNIVITRDRHWQRPSVQVAATLDDALQAGVAQAQADGQTEVMVAGGAQIYALALPLATRLYITTVHAQLEGDVLFPEFDLDAWQCRQQQRFAADERHNYDYTIAVYDK